MSQSVFDFTDYKLYLCASLETSGEKRGIRTRLARYLNCQTAFISQVLRGRLQFSLEHAFKINQFLNHSKDEVHFFLLLVHLARAGSVDLEIYYKQQMAAILSARNEIRERIRVKRTLSLEMQETYYRSWLFAAIHIMLSVPKFRAADAIAKHLGVPTDTVINCLDFLRANGLAKGTNSNLEIGAARIHLSKESPYLAKHHTNWRIRAVTTLDLPRAENLHYSSVISLSRQDALRVREIFLKAIESTEPILQKSKEEDVFCLAMDFFQV